MILLFAFSFSRYGILIKENTYGTLSSNGTKNLFIFKSRVDNIEIKVDSEGQKLNYPDGSYIHIKPKESKITRYSAQTRKSETVLFKNLYKTPWQVNNQVKNIGDYYESFTKTPNMPTIPEEDCYDGQIKVPCGFGSNSYNQFDASKLFSDSRQMSTSSESCSSERSNFNNRAYNGHSSLFRCTLGTGVILVGSGMATLASCVIDPTKLICSAAAVVYVGSIIAYEDNKLACNVSWEDSLNTLKTCEKENSDGDSSGDNGSGSGGLGGGGSGGSICTERSHHSVCTGGGCTRWIEYQVVAC
ncbi:hypothetical protein [Pseudoalteromonas ostreae]|uniref:hypothetical protein n=1 Tax=Pseudoalteromonas ostreae TaxID=2774154 RepID=UPI001B38FA35|nr:hypothetical protein [Pseudoalteromonas ostreae]